MTTATFRENFSLCTEGFICCTHLGYDHTIGNIMKSNDSDWCTKFQSSLLNIYFRLLSLLLIHFRYGPNIYHTAAKRGTEPIRYVTLHSRNPRGAASYRAEITVLWRMNRSPLRYDVRPGPRGTVSTNPPWVGFW